MPHLSTPSRIWTSNLTQKEWKLHNWPFLAYKHFNKISNIKFFQKWYRIWSKYTFGECNKFIPEGYDFGNSIPHTSMYNLSSLIRIMSHLCSSRKDIFCLWLTIKVYCHTRYTYFSWFLTLIRYTQTFIIKYTFTLFLSI